MINVTQIKVETTIYYFNNKYNERRNQIREMKELRE